MLYSEEHMCFIVQYLLKERIVNILKHVSHSSWMFVDVTKFYAPAQGGIQSHSLDFHSLLSTLQFVGLRSVMS